MKWFFLKIINKIKERKFIKHIEICILYAGILFLFLLFQNEILAAFDKTVLPFCENTTNTPYTKVSFIIIVGLCLVLCVRLLATGYRISRKVILPYIIITLIYIYCRIICGYVSIPNLFFNLGYADILIIAGWGVIISARISLVIHDYFRVKSREQNRNTITNRINLAIDNPIYFPNEDQLEYFPVAQMLCGTIRNLPIGKHCSIGLIAPWGTGKTSFLNLLKHNLASKEYLILDFNPRHSKTSSLIQEDFFNLLAGELAYYDSEFSNDLKEYLQSIEVISKNNYVKSILNISKTWARTEEKENLDRTISKHWDRIIVIIEDFDRLLKDEIIEVLKLIDGNASFSNIIFITAFDKTKTISILSSSDDYTFTDKFFDLEFPLPLRPYSTIYKLLEFGLLNLISNDLQKEGIKGLLANKYNIFRRYLPTIRDVKRFINMISLTYPPIEEEVDFIEYILVSLIKYKYIGEFHKIASVNIANQSVFNLAEGKSPIPDEFNKFSSYDILDDIFNRKTPIGFRSIRTPEAYDIYFQDFVYGHLKLKDIKPILDPTKDLNQIIATFNWEYVGNDIMNYLQSRNLFNFESRSLFERFIGVMLHLNSTEKETYHTTQVIKELLRPSGRTMACAKYGYNDEEYKERFKVFLSDRYNGYPITVTKELIITSIDDAEEIIFKHNELLDIAKHNFINFSKEFPTTNVTHYHLMLCCITEIEPSSRKVHIDSSILNMMRTLIEAAPGGYFANFVRLQYVSSDETSNAITCDPFWQYIFKDYYGIERIINTASEETIPNIVLIRNFWKLYKGNEFKPIVFEHDGVVQSKVDDSLINELYRYEIYEHIEADYQLQKEEYLKGDITNTIFHNNCRNWLKQLEKLNLHILSITRLMNSLNEELK